jgi:ATPase subunit of ABC transporter with duplicated ATPase domains
MPHLPIFLQHVSVYFSAKICFKDFSQILLPGQKIGIIGRNGSGKTTLLKIIQGLLEPSEGKVKIPPSTVFGYVPQLPEEQLSVSGGEYFQKALTTALQNNPHILCLDEPTNHLDVRNRQNLLQFIEHFQGTIFVVSHDPELLNQVITTLWHIDDEGHIHVFKGGYSDYQRKLTQDFEHRYEKYLDLKQKQKNIKKSIQKEQVRESQSRRANFHENDRLLKGALKEKGSRTAGKNKGRLFEIEHEFHQLSQTSKLPENIVPHFFINHQLKQMSHDIINIHEGTCGYHSNKLYIPSFYMGSKDRVAIIGGNGSGKTTFLKAIMNNSSVEKEGQWNVSKNLDIRYLDQHYKTFDEDLTPFEVIQNEVPILKEIEIRKHLNAFLLRKNHEVYQRSKNLSGGEKARLALAQIAAKPSELLILDEVTNNLDLETRAHIIHVLQNYKGAMIVISHDRLFLNEIKLTATYEILNKKLTLNSFSEHL